MKMSNNDAIPPADRKWAVILLAAGLSHRMGEQNKLLIPIDGVALVRRTAETYLAAGAELHVVLGHEAELIGAALGDLPLRLVTNPHYADGGQLSSIRAGLESFRGNLDDYEAVLVALADQAALAAEDIKDLCRDFIEQGRDRALVPFWRGHRGNPVIFPPSIIAAILADGPETSPREFLHKQPHLAKRYEAPNDHFVIDIDTPEDLHAFQTRQK